MPLFVALSGYLFYYLWSSGKPSYVNFYGLLRNKVHRLLIPFIVLGTISCLVVAERPLSLMIWGEGSALWFCIMLFWCTLIRWVVNKSNNMYLKVAILLFCISIILYYKTSYAIPPLIFGIPIGFAGFFKACYFYPYFVLGEFLFLKSSAFRSYDFKKIGILTLFYISYATVAFSEIKYISPVLYSTMSLPYIILLYAVVSSLTGKQIITGGCQLDKLCLYSFGIYVFHEPIAWNCYHNDFLLGIFRAYPFIYSLIFTIVVFILCYTLTHFCLKTKVGNYLLS